VTSESSKILRWDPQFDLPETKPTFRYAIFAQQRTGSYWLCDVLTNGLNFGVPTEYLHALNIRQIGSRLAERALIKDKTNFTVDEYLNAIEKIRTSPRSKRFGIKIQPIELVAIFKNDISKMCQLISRYDAVIYLYRKNKLAQAISTTLAMATHKWISDGNDYDISNIELNNLIPLLSLNLHRHTNEDHLMKTIRSKTNNCVLVTSYEEMFANRDEFLRKVFCVLGAEAESLNARAEVVPVAKKATGKAAGILQEIFLAYISGNGSYDF
jgi:trehalose 2-sulfotransferase